MDDQAGLISRRSRNDVPETARRFRQAAEQAGMTVFADIDHGRNAEDVGLDLRPMRLILFGNPRAGTLLMQLAATAGIDLPLKVLIWEDRDAAVWLTYNDPQWLAERHRLGADADTTLRAIGAGLKAVVSATAS